jgi:hypothetical protein
MAEIILKFDSVEEADDARNALDGHKWKMALFDVDQHLRNETKYNEKLSPELYESYESLRDKIREILSDYELQFNY